jgi:hypothetical protein
MPVDALRATDGQMLLLGETLRIFLLEPLRDVGRSFPQKFDQLIVFVSHARAQSEKRAFSRKRLSPKRYSDFPHPQTDTAAMENQENIPCRVSRFRTVYEVKNAG